MAKTSADNTVEVMPLKRDLHFRLPPERIADWHSMGRPASLIFAALSLTFPEGERMFIRSVRNYRDRAESRELQQQVAGFIAQEAMHTREHLGYNEMVRDAGLPVARIDEAIRDYIRQVEEQPLPVRLAVTMSLEHWTAIMADVMLREPEMFAGCEPSYTRLWRWHALEETEHKAVAFDVYRTVIPQGFKSYLLRVTTLLTATMHFWFNIYRFYSLLYRADCEKRGVRSTVWQRLDAFLKFGFGKPGVVRKVFPAWLDYFKPGFHPWQHDNRRYLAELPQLERELAQA